MPELRGWTGGRVVPMKVGVIVELIPTAGYTQHITADVELTVA